MEAHFPPAHPQTHRIDSERQFFLPSPVILKLIRDRPFTNEETTLIRAELGQLGDVIRRIQAASLTQPDSPQKTIDVLPPEILSLIFWHICVPNETPNIIHLPGRKQPREIQLLPVFLGSISRGWRQVAWSTPQLWALLSLHLSVSGVEAEKITFLLDLYLDNICGLLITLCITFGRRYHKNIGGDPIGRVFFKDENMKKFGDLSLHHPPAGWLCRFGGPFSCLVKIHLSGKCDAMQLADTVFFTNAPILRTISIDGILGPLPKISWSLITSLRLENVPSTVALRCLLESPNLVGFHYVHMRSNSGYFADDDEGGDEEPLEIPTTLTFHHLRILEWSFKLTRTFDLFLRRIRLPVLRSLIWAQREKFLANTPPPGVWTFFQNLSSAPLTTLGLCGMFDIDTTFLTHVYHQTPRVESLVLMHCTEATLCAAMSSLSPPTE